MVASGTFGGSLTIQADFVKSIYDTGVEAVIIITNMMAKSDESDDIFSERVHHLLELTDTIPLGFYECPVPYKRVISTELLRKFISTERIIYHKDTCLDINQVRAKIEAGKGYKFGLYDAYMVHAVESLTACAAGLSCVQGNCFPELIAWLCNNYHVPGLQSEAQKLQQFLVDKMDVMHKVYPAVAKFYLQKRGLNISTIIRGNTSEFTFGVRKDIDHFFKESMRFQEELEIEFAI